MPQQGESDPGDSEKQLLHRALDLEPELRRAFLEAHLAPGETLDEALALLEGVEGLGDFLERPVAGDREGSRPSMPDRIGTYRVERVLGWGSMGIVYLARQTDPARPVAVKLLRLDSAGACAPDRFRREADLLALLTHPGIATIYEAGTEDLGAGEQPWFAMEYVEGEALTTHADQRQLDRRSRVQLLVEIARTVQYAHDHGVVHRDLKPDNLLVRPDGRVCVLDFGVARTAADDASFLTLTATGQVLGTLAYMAPEQARGSEVGPAADQYALGVLLYELLCGELPLPVRGCLPHEALRIIADGDWTPPTRHDPGLAGDLEAILATALVPEVRRRYASVGELADDLERWLAGEPVRARPPSRLDGVGRFLRKHPLLVGLSVVALMLLGAAGAIALNAIFDRDREREVSLLFSDRALYEALVDEADELWPLGGTKVPQLDAWLEKANELAGRLDLHRSAIDNLAGGYGPKGTAVGSALGEEWLTSQATELVKAVRAFSAHDGLLPQVRARRHLAANLRADTGAAHLDDWEGAAARVAEDARFGSFDLAPQVGLLPLGPDPESGLEEFALWGSGSRPERASDSGRVIAREGDAVVLVLVPGGESWIGAQTEDPTKPNFAAFRAILPHEGPPFQVWLDPFLIGKFELTQDQWTRLTGFNPSDWEVGSEFYGKTISPLHPVESMSWQQAHELLPRFGLQLPTEAQWEVAARAGSPWARIQGPEPRDLNGYVNWNTYNPLYWTPDSDIWDDGYMTHMPVGALEPNGYGLHHVLGNVWELCLDNYKVDYHLLEHRRGDGLVIAEPDGDVSRRGCAAAGAPGEHYAFNRQTRLVDDGEAYTGVRAARPLWSREDAESWRTLPARTFGE